MARTGHRSLIKDAESYAQQLRLQLELQYPQPVGVMETGDVLNRKKISGCIKKVSQSRDQRDGKGMAREVNSGEMRMWTRNVLLGCQIGKQLQSRQWRACKSYISNSCQLRYTPRGRPRHTDGVEKCRLCRKAQKSVAPVVSGCSAMVQTLYLARHNAALKILSFEILRGYQLADAIPPWYSPDDKVTAYWDVPFFGSTCK